MNTLYLNGNIITLNDENKKVEAMVTSNGKIAFLGNKIDAKEFATSLGEYKKYELDNNTLIPGFYESHGHMAMNCLLYQNLNLGKVEYSTVNECIEVMREQAKSVENNNWLSFMSYDDARVKEKRHLTREDLDKVSTNHRVFVLHVSTHSGYCNTKALESENLLDVFPDGQLHENDLLKFLFNSLPKLGLEDMSNSVLRDQKECLEAGVTTMSEAGFSNQGFQMVPVFRKLLDENKLKINVAMSFSLPNKSDINFYKEAEKQKEILNELHHIKTTKMFMDGSIQPGTAYLTKPYSNNEEANRDPNYRGFSTLNKEILEERVFDAFAHGNGVFIHTNGDAAMDDVLDAIEKARSKFPENKEICSLIHAQTMRTDQIERAKKLIVMPSYFIGHVFHWGDQHSEKYLGEERGSRISPLAEAVEREVPFTLHCDYPVIPESPIFAIHTAVNRITRSGKVLREDLCISPWEALKAYTYNSALQSGEAHTKGSLEVGKLADFTVLNQDILSCPKNKIKDTKIVATIIKDEVVYQNDSIG